MGDESQVLVKPYWVQFHTTSQNGEGPEKAYPFLVVHEGPSDSGSDQKWGWVYVADSDNDAGLSGGVQYLADIGRGGPGQNVSWSELLGVGGL